MENYEKWWTNNLGNQSYIHNGKQIKAPSVSSFESWMGDPFSQDRIMVRTAFGEFDSLLDAGCGACPEYFGLQKLGLHEKYTGIDITPKLVEYNKSRNINCSEGSLNNIPFEDNKFDIVHSRHVVEHMSNIEKPLSEMLRVAKKRVYISFFILPTLQPQHNIKLDNAGTDGELYHNSYSKHIIEQKLSENEKFKNCQWLALPRPSVCLLLINLK